MIVRKSTLQPEYEPVLHLEFSLQRAIPKEKSEVEVTRVDYVPNVTQYYYQREDVEGREEADEQNYREEETA